MKTVLTASVLTVVLSGCATHEEVDLSGGQELVDEVRAKGVAEQHVVAVDVDPSELGLQDRPHPQRQSFSQGCPLDFYTVVEGVYPYRRWSPKDRALQSGYLATYRRFESDSVFEQGRAEIPAPLADELAWFVEEFNRSALKPSILVIGHTNSDGGAAYNQSLSDERAAAVYRYLVALGVPGHRLHWFGVGESTPLGIAGSRQAKSENRRVELVTFIPAVDTHGAPAGQCQTRWQRVASAMSQEVRL